MVVEIVRFKEGVSMNRYACRITDNGKTRYVRLQDSKPKYFEHDEFGVVPTIAITSFQVANQCKEVVCNLRTTQAEVVTEEMVKAESLLGIHNDADNSAIDRVPYDPSTGQVTLTQPLALRSRPGVIDNFSSLLGSNTNKLFDPGNL